nr:hypothetical protein [Tanacetum cinerariifolium]
TAKLMTEVVTAATTQVVAASTPIPAAKPAVVDVSTPISAAKPAAKPKVLKIVPAAPAVLTRKRKGVVIRDLEEELHDDTPSETLSVKDKGKAYLKNTEGFKMAFFKGKTYDQICPIFQARFDANMRLLLKSREEMEKEEEEIIKSINETQHRRQQREEDCVNKLKKLKILKSSWR